MKVGPAAVPATRSEPCGLNAIDMGGVVGPGDSGTAAGSRDCTS